jgi:hypothetical protein
VKEMRPINTLSFSEDWLSEKQDHIIEKKGGIL